MADITVQQLTKYYGDRLILQDVTFSVQPGEKVAILGANGAGKTTLLHILTGKIPHDGGSVALGTGKTVGILDQMPDFSSEMTAEAVMLLAFAESDALEAHMHAVAQQMAQRPDDASLLREYDTLSAAFDAIGVYQKDFEIDRVCNGLDIPKALREQPFSLLSGGEKTRVNLARIILQKSDILLLDEPTNHLDLDAMNWLGDYLDAYEGTVLTVSHDRYFIDQCCARIIELHDTTCEFYAGSYSFYAIEKERRYEEQLKHHEHELAEKKRLEETARKMHQHGTELLAKRAASIEKRIARMKVTDRPKRESRMHVSFGDPNYETEDVLKVRELRKTFDARTIFEDVTFTIRNRERVALLGPNGAGKSTLLRILLGELAADAGSIKKGVGLKPAYLPQQVHFENMHRNLIDTLIYDKNVSMQTARSRLGAFQFSGETQLKTVSMLSGGEKSRLRLCELMYDPLNFLILDEPTNHLDLGSREWIEDAVEAFDGTLLFVSHDRYFIERFATRILYLENGQLLDFEGSYSAFLAHRDRLAAEATQAAPQAKKATAPKQAPFKKTGGTKGLQKMLTSLEREIASLETQAETLDLQMAAHASDAAKLIALSEEKDACESLLTGKLEEWEAVSLELDALL